MSCILKTIFQVLRYFPLFFFFPTANTRKMDCGSGNVSNRPQDDCQKCNHPISSKGKYSLKWHMLIVLNSKHLFGHPDVGKCHILISWNILGSFRSSFLILIASRVAGKFFPTTVYWSHRSSILKSHLFPIRRNGKHNHKYLCKCHHVLLEALFRQLENYCSKLPSLDASQTLATRNTHTQTHPHAPSISLLVFLKWAWVPHLLPSLCSLQVEGICSSWVISSQRKEVRPDSCSLPQKVENKIWRKREKAPLEDCQLSIPASHSPKRKKKSEAARFSFNSFLESSEAVAQSLIFTELDHKWDPACCSVICHRIARMQCPNMERMSCPKHLFLAVSFPALRSKLQLIDKHRSWTPSAPQPSPPLTDRTLLAQRAALSPPYFRLAGAAMIFNLAYVYPRRLRQIFSHPFIPLLESGCLSPASFVFLVLLGKQFCLLLIE